MKEIRTPLLKIQGLKQIKKVKQKKGKTNKKENKTLTMFTFQMLEFNWLCLK